MNPQLKTLLVGGLLSLAGLAVGTVAYMFVAHLVLHGFQAAIDVFMPGVLLMIVGGAVLSINSLLFAVFYTMFIMQRGLTVQNTFYWACLYLVFNLVYVLLGEGMAALSVVGLVFIAAKTAAICFGAHLGLSFFRR